MNEQKLPNAGTNLIPLQVIHKILKGSRASFWLLLILFLGLSSGTAYSQASLSTGSNPAVVVKMGDPLSFSVNVTSTTAMTDAEIEIKAPIGFEILSASPALKPGSLSGDKLSARVVTNLAANTQQTVTFSVKPLCDADVVASSSRLITYNLYASGSSTVLATKDSQPVGNFYTPILSVTYPASANVNLKQTSTRVMVIEQTANNSYVGNIQIIASCDTSGVKITKLEVSKDNSTWTDITLTGLAASVGKYTYTLTQGNTFTPLAYTNNRLNINDKLYVKETTILKKCNLGNVNYNLSYGDGTNFCTSIATGSSTLSAIAPSYVPDILYMNGGAAAPTSPSVDGRHTFQIQNNTADANAIMYDLFVNVYNSDLSTYDYKKAYFSDINGNPILNGTDTVFISLTPNGTKNWIVKFSALNDPTLIAYYQAQGLSDSNGDGVYDDLIKGNIINLSVKYNINFNYHTPCNSSIQPASYRIANLYYKNTCGEVKSFMRPQQGTQSTNNWSGQFWYSQIRSNSLSITNIQQGDQAILSFLEYADPNGNASFMANQIATTSPLFVTVTLPIGLDYDSLATSPIKVSGSTVALSDITIVDPQTITFRNRFTANNPSIQIAVKANGTADTDKKLSVKHVIDYGNTGTEYTFGCISTKVNYSKITPCPRLQLMTFNTERTTFGWTDKTKTVRATKSTGGDVKFAGPYDNVSLTGNVQVNSNIILAANDTLYAEVQYQGNNNVNQPYFVKQPDSANAAQLVYTKFSNPGTPINIPVSAADIKARFAVENGLPVHHLYVDIAPYLRNNGITLESGDIFDIEFLTQTTVNLPTTTLSISGLQMEVYTQNSSVKNSCYSLLDQFSIANYILNAIGVGYTTTYTWNANAAYNNSLWGMYVDWAQSTANYSAGEYRPTADTLSDVTVTFNSLLDIQTLRSAPVGVIAGNEPTRTLTLGTDYTVNYLNGKTIVKINAPKDLVAYAAWGGYMYYVTYDVVNFLDAGKTISFSVVDYSTSEQPKTRVITNASIGTLYATFNNYTYTLTSGSPNQSPKGRRAEWPLTITNQSAFAGTDPILPNSWIAVECPSGVTPVELIDVVTSLPVAASFIQYDTDKYWMKLGDISITTSKDYLLSCTYTVCSNTPIPTLVAKYGMSKVAYPDNPKDGYATTYNSPQFLKGVMSTSLSFTPPVANFTGALAHTPDNILDGTNNFCSDIDFAATFTNGLQTKVSNMVLKVTLPVGMDYNGVLPTVKLGSGAAVAVTNAVQTGRLLEIAVSPTLELDAYGSADQSAVVHFALTTGCGFVSGQQIYADFIGESGCGAKTTKAYNSSQVKIAGLSVIADYLVGGKTITSQLPYQDATTNTGRIVFTGKYVLSGAATPDDAAFIELPGDMNLTAQSGDLTFIQTGNRLSAFFDLTGTAPSGKNYDFTLTLDPVNPVNWDCDSTHYIKVKSGIIKTMTCGASTCDLSAESSLKDSVGFTMNKLNVALSPVIKVTSVYLNATTERVKIEGKLKNLSATATGQFIFDLYTHNGATYVPVGAPGNMVVNAVPANDSTAFTLLADIPNTEDICKLKLVLRKDNMTAGMSNNYLCDSIVYILPSTPVYDLQPVNPVCPMAVNTPVGDNAITGYGYNWSPSTYLSTTTVAKPNFTYNYLATPVYNDTVIGYKVTITRPGGCSSVDSVYIPVKALGYVNFVADTTLCNATPLSIAFADSANTSANPTTYTWTNSNTAIGLGASGSGNINVGSLTNTTLLPITATITVTPTRNGCSGVAKSFVVTVLPEAQITSQPSIDPSIVLSNSYIRPGSNVELSVTSTIGLNVTYQWFWKRLSDGVVITLSDDTTYVGTTTDTLLIKNAYEEENGDYYVTVTGCGSATSYPVTIIAVANMDASLRDLQVNGVTLPDFNAAKTNYMTTVVCNDQQATILGIPNKPGIVGTTGVYSITGNGTFSLQPGDNIFDIVIVAQDMVTTMTYTVNVIRDCYVPKFLKDLEDAVICIGDSHTFEVEVDGQGLTYEWYYGLNRIMGANTNTYTVNTAELRDYERYQVVVRSNYEGFKSSAYSKKARLWVADHLPTTLKFAEYPNPATTGSTHYIKVDGYIDVTKYTWSYDKEGVTFSPGADEKWGNEAWATFGTLAAGNGTLKVTMEHPCGTRELTKAITVKYPTGTEDITAEVVQVYPNPTSGVLKVSGTEANQTIRVTDIAGSTKGTYKTQEGTTTIDLAGYAKGTYIVQYNGKTHKVFKK